VTPTLFDLPIRTPEAAQLAVLIFDLAKEMPITPDLRNRIISRSVVLKLDTIRPYFHSMERDPIHPSAIYVAVDGIDAQPLLLRLAPNATPASGLFPKSILIGRVPGPGGLEIVVNAVPFSHLNGEQIKTFSMQVNRAYQARPAGIRSAIIVESDRPELVYPGAFDAFRTIFANRNLNMAGFTDTQTATWAAIRAGWREGFVAMKREAAQEIVPAGQLTERQRVICRLKIDEPDQAAGLIERCSHFLL
jgi:hypothetical protein